jgi:hypothetical protein
MEDKYERFLDASLEPRRMLQPIEGYQNMPLLSLKEAVEFVVFCCPDIRRRVYIAMSNCENPANCLNQDESASIFLYTMEWRPKEQCLYYVLNETLRTENRQKLIPWFPYLKLILSALYKLPSEKQNIWRGVKLNLYQQYEIGKSYVWWGFASCTQSLAVLESNQFLGKQGARTLFNIECRNGKMIRSHSYINMEDEILLLPATQFVVKSKLNPAPDFYIIELKQVEPQFPLIEPPSVNFTDQLTPYAKQKEEQICRSHDNEKLEQQIDLSDKKLTDRDIPIIVQRAFVDKQCSSLNLESNRIALGSQVLAQALCDNSTLKELCLYKNSIGDNGARHIARALIQCTTIIRLDLRCNGITDIGIIDLSEMLEQNTTLVSLFLDENNLTNGGVATLMNALCNNQTLQVLGINCSKITNNCMKSIQKMFKLNRALTNLHLPVNSFSKQDKDQLHAMALKQQNCAISFWE